MSLADNPGQSPVPIAFAGSPLDRADNIRADAEALGALMNWKARVLKLENLMPELDDAGRLAWGTLADVAEGPCSQLPNEELLARWTLLKSEALAKADREVP